MTSYTQNVEEEELKIQCCQNIFELKYQLNINCHIFKMHYINKIVATKQKPIIDTHKKKSERNPITLKKGITNTGREQEKKDQRRMTNPT